MLEPSRKSAKSHTMTSPKKGALPKNYKGPLASGLNRRAFLKTSSAISLLAGLTACKPEITHQNLNQKPEPSKNANPSFSRLFNEHQKKTLNAVQVLLFPDDGNGPDALAINALSYLEWAMTDSQNVDDGDPEFISRGIGWLDDLSEQQKGDKFIKLTQKQQNKLLTEIAATQAGENWLSLLLYYITEALMLDPVYGGNPDAIGWQWLEHQPGFPAPVTGKTYQDFN